MPSRKPARILDVRPAGPDHQVVAVAGGSKGCRAKPCSDCPWRKDAVGIFPPEAFRLSASTGYDVPESLRLMVEEGQQPRTFSCHQSGSEKLAVCAGYLLSESAQHSLAVRLRQSKGELNPDQVSSDGLELFADYFEMAVANGVSPDDSVIQPCRRAGS